MAQPARETILLVDDEEMVRRLAARILVAQSYRVIEAKSGDEAVRSLQRAAQRIDGVLTDPNDPFLQKPFTAEQLTRKVRAVTGAAYPAVAALSGSGRGPAGRNAWPERR